MQKAKAHHPDVKGSGSTSFAGILRAYQVSLVSVLQSAMMCNGVCTQSKTCPHPQVLSDPAQRDLYDLQHDKDSAGLLRRAAAQTRLVLHMRRARHADGEGLRLPCYDQCYISHSPCVHHAGARRVSSHYILGSGLITCRRHAQQERCGHLIDPVHPSIHLHAGLLCSIGTEADVNAFPR